MGIQISASGLGNKKLIFDPFIVQKNDEGEQLSEADASVRTSQIIALPYREAEGLPQDPYKEYNNIEELKYRTIENFNDKNIDIPNYSLSFNKYNLIFGRLAESKIQIEFALDGSGENSDNSKRIDEIKSKFKDRAINLGISVNELEYNGILYNKSDIERIGSSVEIIINYCLDYGYIVSAETKNRVLNVMPSSAPSDLALPPEVSSSPSISFSELVPSAPERWAERKDTGERPSVFIRRVYGRYKGQGFTRPEMRRLDPTLDVQLSIEMKGMPRETKAELNRELFDRLSKAKAITPEQALSKIIRHRQTAKLASRRRRAEHKSA